MINLTPDEQQIVREILIEHNIDGEVRVFGSRHKGNAKSTSDLDMAIVSNEKMDLYELSLLKEAFEESMLPFRVDVLDWHRISPEFQQHIEEGFTVFQL